MPLRLLFIGLILCLPLCLRAQDDSEVDTRGAGNVSIWDRFMSNDKLTGDWGGHRQRIEDEYGVSLWMRDKFEGWGIMGGGFRTGGIALNRLDTGLNIDMGTLFDAPVGNLFGVFSYQVGGNPSHYVGDSGDISGMAAQTERTRFAAIWYDQSFLDGRFRFKGGVIATDDDFMVSSMGQNFLNYEFNGGLASVFQNVNYPSYPTDAPGVFLYGEPTEDTYVQFGWYVGSAGHSAPADHGFDFEAGGAAGYSFFLEGGWKYHLNGCKGTAKLGAWYNTGEFADFARRPDLPLGSPDTLYGDGGYYFIIDQYLLPEDTAGPRPGVFAKLGSTPHPEKSPVIFSGTGGVIVEGLVPGRPDDVAGLGYSYLSWSRDYVNSQSGQGTPVSSWQAVVEMSYNIKLTKYMTIVPDFQYVMNPHLSQRNATVIGIHVTTWF